MAKNRRDLTALMRQAQSEELGLESIEFLSNDRNERGRKADRRATQRGANLRVVSEQGNTGWKRPEPKGERQTAYVEAMKTGGIVIAVGPAGTGKTMLAVNAAVDALDQGRVDRIVLTRPAVEAGEKIGFLPGDPDEKLAPYLQPLYDALFDRLGGKRLKALKAEGIIQIAPLGFMRGRTISRAFMVLDEMQNATYAQIKMALTRIGEGSTMVMTGDPDQSDLEGGDSGLANAARRLEAIDEIPVIRLIERDIQRHPLVAKVLKVL